MLACFRFFFFFNDTATTEIYTLSLHDALPISAVEDAVPAVEEAVPTAVEPTAPTLPAWAKPAANRVAQPIGGRTYFFSQAAKGTTAADAQAAAPALASAYLRPAAPAQPAGWPPAPA